MFGNKRKWTAVGKTVPTSSARFYRVCFSSGPSVTWTQLLAGKLLMMLILELEFHAA